MTWPYYARTQKMTWQIMGWVSIEEILKQKEHATHNLIPTPTKVNHLLQNEQRLEGYANAPFSWSLPEFQLLWETCKYCTSIRISKH